MLLDATIWIWLPLLFAIGTAFTRHNLVTLMFLAGTLVSALIVDRIAFITFITSLVVLATAYKLPVFANKQQGKWVYYFGWVLILTWCAMLFTHRMPGFNNLQVLDNVLSGPQSMPFSMYLNLDKPLAFFALLLTYPKLLGKGKQVEFTPILIILILLLVLLPVASLLGALRVEVSLPSWWWLFAINNLM
uniref:CPBP family intramembrane glutamic endopeptidase n=1 Tax=Vibrio sp. TaxID=678 RepID=UPI003D0A9E61